MSILPLRQNFNHLTHKRLVVCALALLLNMLLLSVGSIFTPVYAAKAAPTPSWSTFHDPVYGFSIQYPATWTLMPEKDGSHITLFNPATRTSVSPIITTQQGTPAAVLKQALSVAGAKTLTVAGHQAVDSLTPYVPISQVKHPDEVLPGGPQQIRQVILPVTNTTNSTNVYLFRLTQPTNVQGTASIAVQADQTTFKTILNSFTLPVKVAATHATAATPNTAGCDSICWADNNWNFADYTASSTVASGDWQPNYQCAEFVSRAITQNGFIPGLNNGGVNGSFPASDDSSNGHGYGGYLAQNGSTYYLWNVGVPGTPGLSTYLLDNGLATNIGQNVSQAAPGDVVFFFANGSSGPYEHTMFITSISGGNLVLDGHNVAQYHAVVSASGLDIYHLTGAPGSNGTGGTTPPPPSPPSPQVATVKNSNGLLETFSLNKDNNIWHDNQLAVGGWAGARPMQSPAPVTFTSGPAVGRHLDGSLEIFAFSQGYIWHNSQSSPSGGWGGWSSIPQGITLANVTPTVGTNKDGRLQLFALGNDGNIWSNTQNFSGGWSGWSPVQGSGTPTFTSGPTAVQNINGRLEVFAFSQGYIWHDEQTAPSSGWGGWSSLPQSNTMVNATPAVGINTNSTLSIFAQGVDNNIWQDTQNTSGSWNGWGAIQGSNIPTFSSAPAVGRNADGRLEVFAFSQGYIWHDYQTAPSSGWGSWSSLTQSASLSNTIPGVATNGGGLMAIFGVGSDGSLWQNSQNTSSSWSGWGTLVQSQASLASNQAPATGRDADGQLENFTLGNDGNIWYNAQTSSGSLSEWSPLQTGGTPTFSSMPTTIQYPDKHLEVFAFSQGYIWHNVQTATDPLTWSGWSSIPQATPVTNNAPTVVVDANQHAEIFALGNDNAIWYNAQSSTGTWLGWAHLPTSSTPTFSGPPSIVSYVDKHLEVFAFSQGYIWHNVLPAGSTSWSGWSSIPQATPVTNNAPTVVVDANQHAEIFALGNDNAIWYNAQSSTGTWLGWAHLPTSSTPTFSGPPSIGIDTNSNLEVFAFSQGYIWHNVLPAGSTSWSGWSSLNQSTPLTNNAPAVGKNTDGRLELFALGNDGNIWHDYELPGAPQGWSSWWSITFAPAMQAYSPAVGSNANKTQEVVALGNDGNIWYNAQTSAGKWTEWRPIETANIPVFTSVPVLGRRSDGIQEAFVFSQGYIWNSIQTASSGNWGSWSSRCLPLARGISGIMFYQ